MKTSKKLILGIFIIVVAACQNSNKVEEGNNLYTNAHKVEVLEVQQANSYTYLRVEENDNDFWIAVMKMEAEEGMVLYYDDVLEMTGFESKDLGRVFDKIYFIQEISEKPSLPGAKDMKMSGNPQKPSIEKKDVSIQKNEESVSIGELYSSKEFFAGKEVVVRGLVTKFNSEIMGKNWIHIQDGTDHQGKFDLTLTTQEIVKVDDTVTLRGKVSLDKDFGAGYFYEMIIEQASKVE